MSERPIEPKSGRAKLADDEELPPQAPAGWIDRDYDEATERAPSPWVNRLLLAGFMLFMFYLFAGDQFAVLFRSIR